MSKARTLAGTVSDGAVLADGTVDAAEIGSLTLPTGGDIVGTTATQTLTNKTLTNPIVSLGGTNGTSGQVLTSAGTGAAPTWVTVASGLSGATQAEMEAGTSSSVAVTPSVAQHHQSAAKCWIMCNASGAIQASYNITSITDSGVGEVTVTIATDFSSNNYAIVCSTRGDSFSDRVPRVSSQAAGSFVINNTSSAGVGQSDPGGYQAVCFGDQ